MQMFGAGSVAAVVFLALVLTGLEITRHTEPEDTRVESTLAPRLTHGKRILPHTMVVGLGVSRAHEGSYNANHLVSFLNSQPSVHLSAEDRQCNSLEWDLANSEDRVLNAKIRLDRLRARNAQVVGDFALWNLPYAESMLALDRRVRIVALKRPKAESVASLTAWFLQAKQLPLVTAQERARMHRVDKNDLDVCYPTYALNGTVDTQAAVSHYYDDYYARVDSLKRAFPERVQIYDEAEVLSSANRASELFAYIKIPKPWKLEESQTTNSTLEVNPKPASPPKKRRGLRVLHTHAEEGEEATRTNAGSRKTVVIGIGSGRCGTMSLATLLNKQPGTQVSHEHNRCEGLAWNNDGHVPSDRRRRFNARRRLAMLRARQAKVVGDIALWYLPYVPMLLESRNVRVVALKRNREDTVASFERWFGGMNHFPWALSEEIGRMPNFTVHSMGYDKCYPKYDWDESNTPTLREGAERYYDDYYSNVDMLIEKYPRRVRLYNSYGLLNNLDVQRDLFEFLGMTQYQPQVVIGMHPTNLTAAKSNSARAAKQATSNSLEMDIG
mmetsp:Transcript_49562/g.94706  ORF Transcript_49562/g.94706 Transcript_49562/m.94706 type:complete len:555 (-) Transcript_49562:188-1852(-)|eukprot:CAMPEP_0114259664 /NCGR_PEP_ID=MMETSP0058-20121206/20018_1 /TAXON_ID=36894 /ORGANISM="Pyramimonas parkeae, CCMP726" /LENGTH=554 /DNA_ID=CAMNT_0001374735 /DNA_START=290 /DNA_END=1954 /DNA_ORIENTATION=-